MKLLLILTFLLISCSTDNINKKQISSGVVSKENMPVSVNKESSVRTRKPNKSISDYLIDGTVYIPYVVGMTMMAPVPLTWQMVGYDNIGAVIPLTLIEMPFFLVGLVIASPGFSRFWHG